ncbi:MAG: NAD(P)-dependent oxidoreductase [Verrucomicrobia bacterium]|nr:NAD(P)-dependent oxidoreductase [Verrucomicrobiota bacterium]
MRERILITGPGGRVGTQIVPLLREHFSLRLLDAQALPSEGDDEVVQGDIRDFELLRKACEGVAAMVHLAAVSDEADFHTRLLPMNLLGVYNAFEAARQARLRKVVFASTCQTILNYGDGVWVTPEMPVRPRTIYACTKVFGEALARHYADCHGMSMVCLRMAWFQPYDSPGLRNQPEMLTHWCSPRDLTQLIVKSIRADLQFGIFFGLSNNTGRFWDLSNARQLIGYEPQDNGAHYLNLSEAKPNSINKQK